MKEFDRLKLAQEYFKRYSSIYYRLLFLSGLARFDLKDGKIVRKSLRAVLFTMFMLILINFCAFYIWHIKVLQENILLAPEKIILLYLVVLGNSMAINISIFNRDSGARFMNYAIDIDTFLGVDDTKFMRDNEVKTYVYLSVMVFIAQITIVTALYITFPSTILIHITGSVYFFWMASIFYDISNILSNFAFYSLRIRYLNVALMKLGNMNLEYLPRQFLFDGVNWKKEYNDNVKFHTWAERKDFVQAYIMVFNHLMNFQRCFRFPIFVGVTMIILATFVTVQTFISILKSPDLASIRTQAISGATIMSWLFMVMMTKQSSIFSKQVYHTKIICTYMQLKPTNSDAIFKLTRSILRTLEVREVGASIYGLFFFDTKLMLNIAASTLVYITVQLQLAFPTTEVIKENTTSTIAPV